MDDDRSGMAPPEAAGSSRETTPLQANGNHATDAERRKGPQAEGWPHATVIVPVYNEGGNVRGLVESLITQDYPGNVDVLIVDNGSTDETKAILESLDINYLTEREPGSYAARNRGIEEAEGDIVAFTDGDCRPRPGWLREAVGCLRRQEAHLVAGRVKRPPSPWGNLWAAYDAAMYLRQAYYVTLGRAATANLVVRSEVLDAIGPFPQVRSGGDFDWTGKATDAGYRLVYCDGAAVLHPPYRTFREVFRKEARFVRESGILSVFKSIHREEILGKVHCERAPSPRSYMAAMGLIVLKNLLKALAAVSVLLDRSGSDG